MIFVTVGTHEQPFDRLVKTIDDLKRDGIITEDVIMQIGFSTYEPKYCQVNRLISYEHMKEYIEEARIVITHGGPASFLLPLQYGKIPVVVPRRCQFGEHVNDHQIDFVRKVEKIMKSVICVEDINKLGGILLNYDRYISSKNQKVNNNNKHFCNDFERIVDTLL